MKVMKALIKIQSLQSSIDMSWYQKQIASHHSYQLPYLPGSEVTIPRVACCRATVTPRMNPWRRWGAACEEAPRMMKQYEARLKRGGLYYG